MKTDSTFGSPVARLPTARVAVSCTYAAEDVAILPVAERAVARRDQHRLCRRCLGFQLAAQNVC